MSDLTGDLLGRGEPVDVAAKNEQIDEGLTLPDVVPIIDAAHSGPVGRFLNAWWIKVNYILRGVAGTGVQWYIFFAQAATKHPRTAVIVLGLVAMVTEEKFSEQPVITNCIRYTMESLDPRAASAIFAKGPPKDPVGDAARMTAEEATAAYLASPEYAELKLEVEEGAQFRVRRQSYIAAGMLAEAHDVEVAAAARTVERRAERAQRAADERGQSPEELVVQQVVQPIPTEPVVPTEPDAPVEQKPVEQEGPPVEHQ